MKVASVNSNQNLHDILDPKRHSVITFDDNTIYMNRSVLATGSDDPLTIQEMVINALVEHVEDLNKKLSMPKSGVAEAVEKLLAMSDEELTEKLSAAKTKVDSDTVDIMQLDVTDDPKKTICIDCINARRTWSEELQKDGYIGCTKLYDEGGFNLDAIDAAVVGTGWVDLRAYPFTDSQGVMTNGMLVTCGTRKCPAYRKRTL